MSQNKQYLGDSVYASFDGFHIVLTTENDSSGPSNIIMLEDSVFQSLEGYAKRVWPYLNKENESGAV